MSMVQTTYPTKCIAEIFGMAVKNVIQRATRENWSCSTRPGRGGGKLWVVSSMPAETRDMLASAILRQGKGMDWIPAFAGMTENTMPPALNCDGEKKSSIPAFAGMTKAAPALTRTLTLTRTAVRTAALPLSPSPALARASQRERRVALARLALVREVERLAPLVGKEKAIMHLVDAARLGKLSPELSVLASTAVARKCGAALSRRSLYRWYGDYATGGEAALLPSFRKDDPIPAWAEDFLRYYQKPQHPMMAHAHADLCAEYAERGLAAPSIYAVRRLIAKMSAPEREAGRATGNALLKLRPYRRRDTSELWPTDVYTADGTTFDAEVLHPHDGQPFKPELTAVLDVATRRCVGLSISLAESALTVLDALRMACCFGGIPALFYSDGGPGYDNNMLLSESTGMMTRLGIDPVRAIPGRPQGKGLMERAVKTLWVQAAQSLPSYMGALMDKDAAHKNFKLSRKAIKDGSRNLIPTWEMFKAHILARVEEYNNAPHRSLPRFVDPATGKRRHFTPNEYWQTFVERGFAAVTVPAEMATELFMPSELRKVSQGWIQFYGGRYFAKELAEFHGDRVEVRYDIWDASRVWCWTQGGRKICEAALEGNTIPYFPQSRIEAGRERRKRGQVARINDKLQRVVPGAEIMLPELDSRLRGNKGKAEPLALADSTAATVIGIEISPAPVQQSQPVAARPVIFPSRHERYVWCMEHPELQNESDHAFLPAYAASEEYADLADLYAAKDIAF